MKRISPEELERQIQEVEAIVERVKASGVHTEEQFNTLRVMVDVYHDVKREMIKKRPSMRRVRELTRRLRLRPSSGESDDSGEGAAR